MTEQHQYTALLAEGSAVPTLLCGHCHSILSRARIFRNEGDQHQNMECQTIGLCSADHNARLRNSNTQTFHLLYPDLRRL